MLAYTIRRFAYLIPVLFVLTAVLFLFVQLLTGNIIDIMIGEEDIEDPEIRIALTKELGLDQPLYLHYGKWIGRVIFEAIIQRDYPMIPSDILVLGFFVVNTNLVVDIAYRTLNPRVELN